MNRILLVIPVVVIAVGLLLWSQLRSEPYYVSGFIESHQIRVGSHVGGRVLRVHVEEGQKVAKNAPLLELEPYDLNERLAEAEATLNAREATLAKLVAGPRKEEIEAARAKRDQAQAALDKAVAGPRKLEVQIAADQLARAKAEVVKAEKDHARVVRLFEEGRAAEEELDAVVRALAVAQASEAQAQDELSLMREGTRKEDIAAARAKLAEAQETLDLLETGTRAEEIREAEATVAAAQAVVAATRRRVAELTVRAPLDAIVEAVDLRPGDLVGPDAPVIALSDPSELWIRAYVPEDRLDLKLGEKVDVRVDSFSGRRFAGHISFISRDAEFTPSNVQTPEERSKQVFRIKVLLDEGLDELRAGMAADVFLEPAE